MTPEWIEFSRCILFFGNTGAKKDEQLHMASCVLFIFCRLFYYFQNIIGRAVQTSAHFGKNGKVNAGNLVLFRHRDLQFFHHFTEQIAVLRQVDHGRGGAEDLYAVFLQVCGKVHILSEDLLLLFLDLC